MWSGKKVICKDNPGYSKELNCVDVLPGRMYEVIQIDEDGDHDYRYLIKDDSDCVSWLSSSAFKDLPAKVKRITISLASGNVVENRFLELETFSREEIALYAEKFDGYSTDDERIENLLTKPDGDHRSIVQMSDDLIIRYMDAFPQYYIKL